MKDLSFTEAAEEFDIDQAQLRVYAYRGKFPYYKRGSMLFAKRADIEKFINNRNQKTKNNNLAKPEHQRELKNETT